MIQSVLEQTALNGALSEQSALHPKGGRGKRPIVADLLLTALIDAFSILVIFLLMSFSSTGEILYISKGQELPKASQAAVLERNTVIRIDENKIFLEDKEVSINSLIAELIELRRQWNKNHPGEDSNSGITVQADRRLKYQYLSQIVQATNHAGFSDIKFAVVIK